MLQPYDKNKTHLKDFDECVALMRGGSKTFFAASRLLPKRIRQASVALYAFCRVADDLVDNTTDSLKSLTELKQRLDLIYAQEPLDFIEDHALSHVVHQFKLPRPLLDALMQGFEWDTNARFYESIEDVHAYGARVAGSVGAMMSWIMGARHSSTLARACELGVAMQLTNIARDVGEDARNGRLYLPTDWMKEEGIDPVLWLKDPILTPGIQAVVGRLLEEADRLYQQSSVGVADLAQDCRAAIYSARLIYAEIGQHLRAHQLDSINQRSVVPMSRKLWLLCQAKIQAPWIVTAKHPAPALDAIDYLVKACEEQCAVYDLKPEGFPNRGFPQRVEWVLELIERRLEDDKEFVRGSTRQSKNTMQNLGPMGETASSGH
jgi:phytoene synthase